MSLSSFEYGSSERFSPRLRNPMGLSCASIGTMRRVSFFSKRLRSRRRASQSGAETAMS